MARTDEKLITRIRHLLGHVDTNEAKKPLKDFEETTSSIAKRFPKGRQGHMSIMVARVQLLADLANIARNEEVWDYADNKASVS